ncbi:MAG: GGDEF domain-containing protein [Methylotenera sp.]
MTQVKLESVLEKIITLTSERDSGSLELALAQTLFALLNVENLTIHTAGNINRVRHALANAEKLADDEAISPNIVDALNQCLETAKTNCIVHRGKQVTMFPLKCSKQRPIAVVLVEQTHQSPKNELIIQILKIYHNFLSLMTENERDTLTGLLNRKTFDLKINNIITQQQVKTTEESAESTFLAIFDIDHFKRVNDVHGHLIGDEVLLLFASLMEKNFRDIDLLFRFGGEEFIGLFQCPDHEAMQKVLNRFRQLVETFTFPQVGTVTVSCGFTKIEDFDLSSNIIDRADNALYHAKNNGRNQVCHHEKLVALGLLAEEDVSGGEIELF